MKQSMLFAVLMMFLSTIVVNAQVSTFPYSYDWNNATMLHGDGNYDTTSTGKISGGTPAFSLGRTGYPISTAYIQYNCFVRGTSSFIMSVNTDGLVFTGAEVVSFFYWPQGPDSYGDMTFQVLCEGNGDTSMIFLNHPLSGWGTRTISLPAFLGNCKNAKIIFQLVDTSSSHWTPWIWVRDFSLYGGALPIQLGSFSATRITSQAVTLTWTTISEINNYGFYVQRDGCDIGFVAGHGTTLQHRAYGYTDKSPLSGQHTYRLKQVDLDLASTLSDAVFVDVPAAFMLNQNYPNPFNPSTTIQYCLPQKSNVQLTVTNSLGQQVESFVNGEQEAGYHEVRFDGSGLASAVYFYRLTAGLYTECRKMVLMK